MKPFKGYIRDWKRRYYGNDYVIVGVPMGHPEFKDWIITSKVISDKHVEMGGYGEHRIETLNSLYLLIGPELEKEVPSPR